MENVIKKQYRTLLFDVDGTLLDFDAAENAGLHQVLSGYAGPKEIEDMIRAYRRINKGLWEDYENGRITKDQITDTRFDALWRECGIDADGSETERRYRQCLNRSANKVDGAKETLEYLQSRYVLYVVTNGFTDTQTMRMEASGLGRYFRHSFISEEVGYQKPQKEFFDYCFAHMTQGDGGAASADSQRVRQTFAVNRDETLIIGDSLNSDMKGGNIAGIDTCWYNPAMLERDPHVKVDMEIRSLMDLTKLL